MNTTAQTYKEFLEDCFSHGDYATDDVIAFVLPLFEEVISFHEAALVAPFEREPALVITNRHIDIDENFAHAPLNALQKVNALFEKIRSANFNITGNIKLDVDVNTGMQSREDLHVHLLVNEPLQHPAYVPGYSCYEIMLGNHDALTDIFCLGLILGSMALSLDLYDEHDLEAFVATRANPVFHNSRIHPAIGALIKEMTELDRSKRAADLYDIINRLRNYRDYDPEKQTDLSNVAGWVNKELTNRSQYILSKLRNRLFDTSRRNRLLYYKPNMRFVNLTVSSVPMVLHYQSIRPDLLFSWNNEIAGKITGMKDILLNKYLRFEDHLYLPSSLDKIRTEAQRDVQEYGFSQLKLVPAFLNWNNLREDKDERIQSPLLLLPVELKKNKKLKEDHYVVTIKDNVAEVNPVLANFLRDLYGIKLPDFVDLDEMSMAQFFEILRSQIEGAGQGITLEYAGKPKIKLVHSIARQTVNNYRRRLRRNNGQLDSYKNIAYSYQTENYQPLGLEIFKQRVQPRPSLLEFLVNDDIRLNSHHLTGEATGKERQLFELAGGSSNPYHWEFDVCNMVLGNFNYKKMSLVRDYNYVIDHKTEHKVFEQLFSEKPRQHSEKIFDLNKPDDWYHIITADPTQTKAILQGRTGESYIIQGPPGTGKSQTITNLIADFAARGKSVLFVCEKRAALDVVYFRLKQQQLDELCCYIHDSQGDKREFIKNLKATYEDFIRNKMSVNEISLKRTVQLQQMNEQVELLRQFHFTNNDVKSETGIRLRNLIERVIELKNYNVQLQPREEELLPNYKDWLQFGNSIRELSAALEESGAEPQFAEHPFSKINDSLFVSERPHQLLDELTRELKTSLQELDDFLAAKNIAPQHSQTLEQIKNLVQDAVMLLPLAESDNLRLVNTANPEAKDFDKRMRQLSGFEKELEHAKDLNINWKQRFSEQDTGAALAIAKEKEDSFFSFLNGEWRRLKKQLEQHYAFENHQVKPAYSKVLQQLQEEYLASEKVSGEKRSLQQKYNIANVDLTYVSIEMLRSKQGDQEIDYLLQRPDSNELVIRLSKFNHQLYNLDKKLKQLFNDYETKTLRDLSDDLESISLNTDGLKELLPALRSFASLPAGLKKALCNVPLSPVEAEAAMANKSLGTIYRHQKIFAGIDMNALETSVKQIGQHYKKLLKLNAAYVRAITRQRFLQHVELSNMAVSQLDAEQKQFKKNYSEGRRILENEFGKSMRYKSIRELTAKESGAVLKDLKPVWLMSPLSVSDSLPVDTSFFDIIIFDEASQITLEEGVPALYRAPQTVIVGDDKQMPPSSFFSARTEDPDDIATAGLNDEDELLSNDADSLLMQGAKKLDSVMLGWHYRSRYETLISYSNHAFYDAGLLTIPDKQIHDVVKPAIDVNNIADAGKFADALFDRSISFHFHPDSVYEKRNNQDEADYIAQLVRELLKRNIKESVGIVAFSQEQQHTIEDALTALAQTDKVFEQQLEESYDRTDEDQFTGLFVKNLENVQGDERDIIIMSVCYGFDSRKKMIMNFGPINKKGGEKRLNVIFSRAKKHMAIVSSIKHFNITNEYNEGANYFRRFLQYAELVSVGNMDLARVVLDGLVLKKERIISGSGNSIVLKEIKQRLEQKGYRVTPDVGQSDFKSALAVKLNAQDDQYTLSILLDDDRHYSSDNLLEQYYQRPAILKSFGWKMIFVSGKDWLHQPDRVMELIEKKLHEKNPEEIEETEESFVELSSSPSNIAAEEGGTLFIRQESKPIASAYDDLNFRRLEWKDDTSSKFWEVATDGHKLIVRYGRIGTRGQVQVKTFADFSTAEKEREKLVKEKLNKGYRDKH